MWKHLLAIVIGSGLVLSSAVGPSSPAQASSDGSTTDTPAVELVDLPAPMVDMADWAVALFAEADLELPPLRFVHHGEDTTACAGRVGMHHDIDGVSIVELCTVDTGVPTQMMILHETAHAWADHQLTDEAKEAFRELRGWEHWRDYSAAAWHENGTEQAAEILVWGLIDRPIMSVRIDQNSCAELLAGYRTLTGADPLHGYEDYC